MSLFFIAVSQMGQWKALAAPGGGFEQLAAALKAGKARFRGISSHSPDVLREAIGSGLCDLVMFPIGPYCSSRYLNEILPAAKSKGIGTVCFKTFGAGKLLGDTTGYNRPLETRPRGKFSSGGKDTENAPELPRLAVAECLHYTLTAAPDCALLGLSFPNEQDAAFAALSSFSPLEETRMADIRSRAAEAIQGKGPVWWDPPTA